MAYPIQLKVDPFSLAAGPAHGQLRYPRLVEVDGVGTYRGTP